MFTFILISILSSKLNLLFRAFIANNNCLVCFPRLHSIWKSSSNSDIHLCTTIQSRDILLHSHFYSFGEWTFSFRSTSWKPFSEDDTQQKFFKTLLEYFAPLSKFYCRFNSFHCLLSTFIFQTIPYVMKNKMI